MERGKQPLLGESCMRVDAIAKVTRAGMIY